MNKVACLGKTCIGATARLVWDLLCFGVWLGGVDIYDVTPTQESDKLTAIVELFHEAVKIEVVYGFNESIFGCL
jgi:hypothetical protein